MASIPEAPRPQSHTLPPPFDKSSTPLKLVTQGAEALVYRTKFLTPTTECALKVRPSKPYRHPTLDKRLTRQRILAEARVLVRCRKEGVSVPSVLGLDWENGWVAIEWIAGSTIRRLISSRSEWLKAEGRSSGSQNDESQAGLEKLLACIGRAVGKLHSVGIVHGDLTTSNLIVRPTEGTDVDEQWPGKNMEGEVVLIDFGLAQTSNQDEDRAVDLYVLERAFASTHPECEDSFSCVLQAYGQSYKGAKAALKKLDEVRMRGRKKSMLG